MSIRLFFGRQPLFCLDTPASLCLERVTRFSGWYVPDSAQVTGPKLHVCINGSPVAALRYGAIRSDVAKVYPANDRAPTSGFVGDVVISRALIRDDQPFVSIVDVTSEGSHMVLYGGYFQVSSSIDVSPAKRPTAFNLENLLCCPECNSTVDLANESGRCPTCQAPMFVIEGIPHMLRQGEAPLIRLSEGTFTHPYCDTVLKLLDNLRTGTILDFGAGNTPPSMQRQNVCQLDVQQYPTTHVVSTRKRLPFRDGVFDAVISQAVFEHLSDPNDTAGELFRVLKPAGLAYVDTAFMQPLHGDPEHYFNMTRNGIRRVMAQFCEIESGVASHQYPSFGFRMQLESVLPHMAAGVWRSRMEALYRDLQADSDGFDRALGSSGVERLAAGFYYLGYKPRKTPPRMPYPAAKKLF
jgi:SAM-dependent methyltransferase/uncharacterized protein YbaR (Trm112 family)